MCFYEGVYVKKEPLYIEVEGIDIKQDNMVFRF